MLVKVFYFSVKKKACNSCHHRCMLWFVMEDFSLDYPKLQYYGTVHMAHVPCCNQDLHHEQTAHKQYINDVGQINNMRTKI